MTTDIAAAVETVNMGQVTLAFAPTRLTAVLGSCVAAVLFEPRSRAAVMAHIVLAGSEGRNVTTPGKFADTAVPHMLKLLQQEGLPITNLQVRIAGGASMFGNPTGPLQVGESNAAAVIRALAEHKLTPGAKHLGGIKGRRITFNTQTGQLVVEVVGSPPVTL